MDWLPHILMILGVLGFITFKAYIFFYRPELYAEQQRQKHEREMAKQADRNKRVNSIVGGIAGGVVKALLGGVFKRHH